MANKDSDLGTDLARTGLQSDFIVHVAYFVRARSSHDLSEFT